MRVFIAVTMAICRLFIPPIFSKWHSVHQHEQHEQMDCLTICDVQFICNVRMFAWDAVHVRPNAYVLRQRNECVDVTSRRMTFALHLPMGIWVVVNFPFVFPSFCLPSLPSVVPHPPLSQSHKHPFRIFAVFDMHFEQKVSD